MARKIISAVKKKINEFRTRETAIRPKTKQILSSLKEKYSSPKEYFDKRIQAITSEFFALNDVLRSKESPINPKDIKLDPKDPRYNQKSKQRAIQTILRLTNRVTPKKIGNIFEIKLVSILKNKKLSAQEKKKLLTSLIEEVDSIYTRFEIGNKIRILESEVSKNVERATNIFKEIDSFLKSNSVNPVEKKELLSFLESWKRNLRNTDAILREYKSKLSDLELLKQKIKTEISRIKG